MGGADLAVLPGRRQSCEKAIHARVADPVEITDLARRDQPSIGDALTPSHRGKTPESIGTGTWKRCPSVKRQLVRFTKRVGGALGLYVRWPRMLEPSGAANSTAFMTDAIPPKGNVVITVAHS